MSPRIGYSSPRVDELFKKDPAKLGLAGEVRIHATPSVAKISFQLGGQPKIDYINSIEQWRPFSWPAPSARLIAVGAGASLISELPATDGTWALLHFLDAGHQSANSEYLEWTVSDPLGHRYTLDFKPATLRSMFRKLELPHAVVSGVAGCGQRERRAR